MHRYLLEIIKETDVGQIRRINEDCVGVDNEKGIFVLADGMGGHASGEIASAMAVDFLLRDLAKIQDNADPSLRGWEQFILDQLELSIVECNKQIFEAGKRGVHMDGMGTTVVSGLVIEEQLFYAHVGDSRLYRLREGHLEQLTEDHSLLQEAINSFNRNSFNSEIGIETTIPGNIITRALGVAAYVQPDTASTYLKDRDIYLSCSDGLTDLLKDETILETMEASNALAPIATQLILQANEAGGEDNISVVLLGAKRETLIGGIVRLFS
ncbi:MAG: serine/threonine-protein phosphatase [Gammaproteobacteria bacterium]|nr:serine/threonine-protein phosphatase [Gammaproteobacteria bacterium]